MSDHRQIDTTEPRCGCCFAIAQATAENEGYSDCCNDRIEYPSEYLDDPEFAASVKRGEVTE